MLFETENPIRQFLLDPSEEQMLTMEEIPPYNENVADYKIQIINLNNNVQKKFTYHGVALRKYQWSLDGRYLWIGYCENCTQKDQLNQKEDGEYVFYDFAQEVFRAFPAEIQRNPEQFSVLDIELLSWLL